jgi:hypothetical protein
MALGVAVRQNRFEAPREILGDRLREGTIYRLLADHGGELFPDDYFADLYKRSSKGRPTVPARILATVMLLQSFEGLSDREATDRLEVDLRWAAAAGTDTGPEAFHPTVLVGLRNRLRASGAPRRLFEDTKALATSTGVLRHRARVLDSTPLYDAVATQDTVTMVRAAIRKVLACLDMDYPGLASAARSVLARDDDYATPGKPPCDWDDPSAREVLIDALVKDALALLQVLHGEELEGPAADAAELLALVAGQDVAEGDDGVFRIVRGVATDRVISTVDPEARHGHKSKARRFDGYKAHVSVDPDSEIIDEVTVTPANSADRDAIDELLGEDQQATTDTDAPSTTGDSAASPGDKPEVVGDAAYGDGATRQRLGRRGRRVRAKLPPSRNRAGRYTKDRFAIDTETATVTCPAGKTVAITASRKGGGRASFAPHCDTCPLRKACTAARSGRSIAIHPHEALLQAARAEQQSPEWIASYRADRPIVERKIAHFVRRAWGGRRARCRGTSRILTDVETRAAAINLARLAALGLGFDGTAWVAP